MTEKGFVKFVKYGGGHAIYSALAGATSIGLGLSSYEKLSQNTLQLPAIELFGTFSFGLIAIILATKAACEYAHYRSE